MPVEQLLLPLKSAPIWSLRDLPASTFGPIRQALFDCLDGILPAIQVVGSAGSGRTLLTQALAAEASERGLTVAVLPLWHVRHLSPEMVQGLEHLDVLILDDLEAVLTDPDWTLALFHVHNALSQNGGRLLTTAQQPVSALTVSLPDLQSRLARGAVYPLTLPTDEDRLAVLQRAAERKGWLLSDEVQRYAIARGPRSLGRFIALIDDLDRQNSRDKCGIQIAQVRHALARFHA